MFASNIPILSANSRLYGGAAWTVVHYGHLPEAVALLQGFEEIILSAPGFQHGDFAHFEDEHRIALIVLAEKELVRRDRHHRTQGEQELEDLGPDSAKDGHSLQEFDPRFLHAHSSDCDCGSAVNSLARLLDGSQRAA
jgi:hypothetical protein